jgi:VWFA-related protein
MKETLAVLLTATLLLAQNPTAPAPAPKEPVKFTVTTQLVTLNLSAKDKDGNPITGLKPGDIILTEDGKKQKIAICEYQKLDNTPLEAVAAAVTSTPPAAAPAPPAGTTAPAAAPATPAPTAAAPTTVATGKPGEIKYKDRRLLVLYFDMTSMPLQDQIRAQENGLRFVRSEMTAADTVSVMSFTSRLNLLQDFTTDRDLLARAIDSLIAGEGSDMAATADDASITGAAYTADDTEFDIFNADRKLVALQSAIKALGALPEKKGLMYFTSGFNKSGTDNEAQMRATTNAAIRYNVALFPVDARGLSASLAGDATKGSGSASSAFAGAAISAISSYRASQETLHTMAADTGGKELLDSNDLASGIVQAQKEINDYYILGYYSTNQALDGQFRRIKLEIVGNKTARLDYRSGYFAGKEFKQFTASDRERQLQEALLLGDPMTDLSLKLELNYFRLAQDRYFIPLEAKIPASEIDLARHGDVDSVRLDFIGQVTDAKNKVVRQVRDNLEVKLKGVNAAEFAKKTLAYDAGFELPPGTYTVKFLARENLSGKMGTFETKLAIPDLAAEKSWLPISSVVLSNQVEAQSAALATGDQDKKAMADHPLIQNGQKIVPSVTRAFRRDQTLYVYLEAFEPDAPQPLQATVAFYRGTAKVFETPMQLAKDGFKAQAKVQPVRMSFPLSAIEAGRYTCQVNVIDPQSQKVAFWRAPVAVLP